MKSIKESIIGRKSSTINQWIDDFKFEDLKPGIVVNMYDVGVDEEVLFIYLPGNVVDKLLREVNYSSSKASEDAFIRCDDDGHMEGYDVGSFMMNFPHHNHLGSEILDISSEPMDISMVRSIKDVKKIIDLADRTIKVIK